MAFKISKKQIEKLKKNLENGEKSHTIKDRPRRNSDKA